MSLIRYGFAAAIARRRRPAAYPVGVAAAASVRRQSEFQAVFRNLDYFKEDCVSVQPPDMSIELLPFQKEGVGWMLKRELEATGGIMADHLGMGKTVQMIGLALEGQKYAAKLKAARAAGNTTGDATLEQLAQPMRAHRGAEGHRIITVIRQLQRVPAVGNCSKITQPGKDLIRLLAETEAQLQKEEPDFSANRKDLEPWLQFTRRYHAAFEKRARLFLESAHAESLDDVDTPELRTLVVVPAALLYQWGAELRNKVHKARGLNIYTMHSVESRKISPAELEAVDFAITTYDIVTRMARDAFTAEVQHSKALLNFDRNKAHPVFQINWKRLILDEAHVIRNPAAIRSQAVMQLQATRRWAVTATPFHNSIGDMQSLMKFSGSAGLPTPGGKNANHATVTQALLRDQALQRSVARALMPVLLRRSPVMRRDGRDVTLVDLPPKHEIVMDFELLPAEADAYNNVLVEAQTVAAAGPGRNMTTLAMMMRLRQACLHGWLIEGAKLQAYLCNICNGQAVDTVHSKCGHAFCYECLRTRFLEMGNDGKDEVVRVPCPTCDAPIPKAVFKSTTSSVQRRLSQLRGRTWVPSSKVKHTLDVVRDVLANSHDEKVVIFSQFTSFLDVLTIGLEHAGIASLRIDGTMPIGNRNAVISRFATDSTRVLLASKMAVGVGLNLTSANHVIVTDPWWNPAIEEQAVHRCHRIGQKRPVHITRLVARDTIEDYCVQVANRKKKFGDAVLAVATEDDEAANAFSNITTEALQKLEPIKVSGSL
jgi:SNF2 family DNA or RNA helicase